MGAKDFKSFLKEYSKDEQAILKKLHSIIKKAAPQATEKMAWNMPTFYQEGNLIHLCGFTHHVSIFPGSEAMKHFLPQLAKYKTSAGTVQFPHGQPLPTALITKIVKFCVKRNLADAKAKAAKKAAKKSATKKKSKSR